MLPVFKVSGASDLPCATSIVPLVFFLEDGLVVENSDWKSKFMWAIL